MNNNQETNTSSLGLSQVEKLLCFSADVEAGEGKNILLLMFSLFFLLVTAYLLKPVKEALILTQGSAELRSYTIALQVVVIFLILPAYGYFSKSINSKKFMIYCSLFFSGNLFIFYLLGLLGVNFSIVFFIWLGSFGILMISQFWAFASQVFSGVSGERLFPLIAIGASLGGWAGSAIAKILLTSYTPYDLILISSIPLLLALFLACQIHAKVPALVSIKSDSLDTLAGGFKLIVKNRYLILIAIFVILINWCISTSDYLLALLVEKHYLKEINAGTILVSKESYIGMFYSNFYFWVNCLGLFIQTFFVARLIKFFGFHIAFVITPVLLFLGYSFLAFYPIISLFRLFKVTENGLNYSLQSTTLQILYTPTSRREKYEARAFIDSVCWKTGDLLQAITVFVAINYLNFIPKDFVFLNISLALVMIVLAYFISKEYLIKTSSI